MMKLKVAVVTKSKVAFNKTVANIKHQYPKGANFVWRKFNDEHGKTTHSGINDDISVWYDEETGKASSASDFT